MVLVGGLVLRAALSEALALLAAAAAAALVAGRLGVAVLSSPYQRAVLRLVHARGLAWLEALLRLSLLLCSAGVQGLIRWGALAVRVRHA